MLLLLVRHAETAVTGKRLTGWLPGYHLSGKGQRQAEAVAERLGPVPVAAVYSSPIERCTETAAPIAAPHRLEVKIVPDLGEMRYGDWEGRPLKAIYRTKAWSQMIARPSDFRFPNGETIREAQTRFIRGAESLLERHRGKAVVAVTHADVIRLIVSGYLGLSLDLYQRMSVAPASVSAMLLGDRIPRLLRMGETGSFDDLVDRLKELRPPTGKKTGKNRMR